METTGQFCDIYGYYVPPLWMQPWFWVAAGIVLCALLVGVVYWWASRKKRPLSAREWAMRELRALSPDSYSSQEEFKRFYFQLTHIIKEYLCRRYEWRVGDKTDVELLEWLEQQHFYTDVISMLQKVANGAVWIKFANAQALRSQAGADFQLVVDMIKKTAEEQPAATDKKL